MTVKVVAFRIKTKKWTYGYVDNGKQLHNFWDGKCPCDVAFDIMLKLFGFKFLSAADTR